MSHSLKRAVLALAFAAATGAGGCALYVRVPMPPPGAVFVTVEPPRMRDEVVIVRPGVGYVWLGGYWMWREPGYLWVPGRWMMPPPPHREWVPGRWYHERRGWFWMEGHWR